MNNIVEDKFYENQRLSLRRFTKFYTFNDGASCFDSITPQDPSIQSATLQLVSIALTIWDSANIYYTCVMGRLW